MDPLAQEHLIEGFILAGGASSRMGVRKAGLNVGNRSLVRRCADQLGAVTDRIRIVGDRDETVTDVTLPWLADVVDEERGAIRGLVTGLEACERQWALILACDLPFVSGEFLKLLTGLIDPGFDAIVPVQPDGRLQPLCALYRVEACLPAAKDAMGDHRWSLHRLLDKFQIRRVETAEYESLGCSKHLFFNVNSPEDLAAAAELASENC